MCSYLVHVTYYIYYVLGTENIRFWDVVVCKSVHSMNKTTLMSTVFSEHLFDMKLHRGWYGKDNLVFV